MENNTTPRDRLDALDAERFETMLASPPFRHFLERVGQQLERTRCDCETASDTRVLVMAQGSAHAFRTILALPAMMLREMKGLPRK